MERSEKSKDKKKEPLKILQSFTEIKADSKAEGKKIFGQIIEKLK